MPFSDDELIPISALQHFAYCPRQCALIHVEQVWDENIYTLRGRRAHERVDQPNRRTANDVRVEYALPLLSRRLGLVGRADVIEFPENEPLRPVEHKVGRPNRYAGIANAIQLCAQALCLEEMFDQHIPEGDLFYGRTRRRRNVHFDTTLRNHTEDVIRKVRTLLKTARLPTPVADERCSKCSLLQACMPYVVSRLGATEDNLET